VLHSSGQSDGLAAAIGEGSACTRVAVTRGAPVTTVGFPVTMLTTEQCTEESWTANGGGGCGRLMVIGGPLPTSANGAAEGFLVVALADDAVVLFARFWFSRRVNQLDA
jgi:hypothetical protein